MTTTPSVEETSEALKCQTWILRVSIHCQGCKRKVKKVLHNIDGVYTTTIDSQQQQRVTVTGNIRAETLIRKLMKTGKHAELWPENLATKEKMASKANKENSPKSVHNHKDNGNDKRLKLSREGFKEEAKNGCKPQEKSSSGQDKPAMVNGVTQDRVKGSEGKKKKNKGQKAGAGSNHDSGSNSGLPSTGTTAGTGYQNHGVGLDQFVGPSNLSPTLQYSVPLPQGFYIPSELHASSYKTDYPSENPAPFYYVPPSPCPYPSTLPATTLDSFHMFSDDNVDGCSIM